MSARRLLRDPALDGVAHFSDWDEWVRPSDDGSTPGAWVARLRFSIDERITTRVRFAAEGGYELSLDGESIGRSPSDLPAGATSHEHFEIDLSAGRHELFATLWSITYRQGPPAFGFVSEHAVDALTTGIAPWVAARLTNVQFTSPISPRAIVVGEPTGPGGMDRGADWQPARRDPEFAPGSWYDPVRLQPIPQESIESVELLQGPGEVEEFRSVFGEDGLFTVPPGELIVLVFELPEGPFFTRLRASGGADALIRIGVDEEDPINADVYGPRGFRQDFSSFGPLQGGEVTISLEGGERGMALFRLEFFEETAA